MSAAVAFVFGTLKALFLSGAVLAKQAGLTSLALQAEAIATFFGTAAKAEFDPDAGLVQNVNIGIQVAIAALASFAVGAVAIAGVLAIPAAVGATVSGLGAFAVGAAAVVVSFGVSSFFSGEIISILAYLENKLGFRFVGERLDLNEQATEEEDLLIGDRNDNDVRAGGGDDEIYGNRGNDRVLDGESGNDRIFGGDGDDFLVGGADNDYLEGGDGHDTLNGTQGENIIYGDTPGDPNDAGDDLLIGGFDEDKTDQLFGGPGDDQLFGNAGDDLLVGDDIEEELPFGNDQLDGGTGSDTLIGGGGQDWLFGGVGDDDDILIGGAGADQLIGGGGLDLASYVTSSEAVTVDLQTASGTGDASGDTFDSIEGLEGSVLGDNLRGDANENLLLGNAGADVLVGGRGSDTLRGGDGSDILFGGEFDLFGPNLRVKEEDWFVEEDLQQADVLDGGRGNDAIITAAAGYSGFPDDPKSAGSIIEFGTGDGHDIAYIGLGDKVRLKPGTTVSFDTTSKLELPRETIPAITRTGAGDTLTLIVGFGTFGFPERSSLPVIISPSGQTLFTLGAVAAKAREISVIPKENLTAWDDHRAERATGKERDGEPIDGTPNGDNVDGTDKAESINPGGGDDVVNAGGGDDLIVGGSGEGDDVYNGGEGIDTVVYSSTTQGITVDLATGTAIGAEIDTDTLISVEEVVGGTGDDVIAGDDNANLLIGGAGADHLLGRGSGDVILGGGGADTIDGGQGADDLRGGGGADVLIGGEGDDILDGQEASDVAIFAGNLSEYTLTINPDNVTLVGPDGTDTLQNIEVLRFDDRDVSLRKGSEVTDTVLTDSLVGTSRDDLISGLDGDDNLEGRGGFDTIDGGAGQDTAVYSGAVESYVIERLGSGLPIRLKITDNAPTTGPDEGQDTLSNIELVQFANYTLVLVSMRLCPYK